jgi:hypothetical protein
MEAVKVFCPECGKRLFDLSLEHPPGGTLRIRCRKCKTLDVFDLSVYNKPDLQNRSDSASHKAPEPNP